MSDFRLFTGNVVLVADRTVAIEAFVEWATNKGDVLVSWLDRARAKHPLSRVDSYTIHDITDVARHEPTKDQSDVG